jgi:uncharacterized damage-inducible protein DinB
MIVEDLINLFRRDLSKLKNEIELYKNEDRIWHIEKSITNSAGNLCLHLIGNLKTYIGAGIGNINYVRDRDLEFSAKDIQRSVLLKEIDDTIIVVQTALQNLKESDIEKDFPILIWDHSTTISFTLLHLLSHLNYHLGQINYHRRLLDN